MKRPIYDAWDRQVLRWQISKELDTFSGAVLVLNYRMRKLLQYVSKTIKRKTRAGQRRTG